MDEPKPRNTYDHAQTNEEEHVDYDDYQPRKTCPNISAILIQGLEEVMEMSEESDITSSHQSYYDRD